MIRQTLILVLMTALTAVDCLPQTGKDEKLAAEINKYGQAEVVIPWPGRQVLDLITGNVSVTAVKNERVYITLSPATLYWFLSAKLNYEIIERADSKGLVSASSVREALEWDSYPTYTQYDSIMRKFASDYPSLCDLDTIGTSINGRLVLVLKISDNVSANEQEPKVFYSSTMHGDELAGFVLMLRLADYLLKNYNSLPQVKNLVENLEIWINPLANPDGTYRSGNVITYPTRSNANGIDLNRNFPDPLNPSIVPEKENVDMMAFMRKHRFVLSANFHSGSEVVNFPWDRWVNKFHADHNWFYYISRKYADTVHVYSGPAYMNFRDNGVTLGWQWYSIYGGRQDFITYELQGREVTIELDDIKLTPAAQLALLWQYNRQSLLGYLENALYGIHGKVIDYTTKLPVSAKIFIAGHDKDSSHIYADTLSGRFVRMLSPGQWNLTFTAPGYRDTVITAVNVTAGQRTNLLVEMKTGTTKIDTAYPDKPVLFPNPAAESIECRLPETLNGTVRVTIINSAGVRVADFISAERPLRINVSRLGAGTYTVIFRSIASGISFTGRFVKIPGHY